MAGKPVAEPYRQRFSQWFGAETIYRKMRGKGGNYHNVEKPEGEDPFFWSHPRSVVRLRADQEATTAVLSFAFPPPVPAGYRPDLRFYAIRGPDADELFDSAPAVSIAEYREGVMEAELPVPAGSGDLWIGWTINAVNLSEAGVSNDDRDLGIWFRWLGLARPRD